MLEKLRILLARPEANVLQLTLLGALVGALAGAVIILFRLGIDLAQMSFLPDGHVENYEGLPRWAHFVLPAAGGVILGILFQAVAKAHRSVGVVHTIERLEYFQGHLPWRNMVMQYFGASLSIIFGHSVGREGPSIHLGAASGSLLGQILALPNNSIRTLVACGIAAAIAASFNTPLAGVIFTIEVIMLEYTFASMLPLLLAAVIATVMSRAVFGQESMLAPPPFDISTQQELWWVAVTGVVIGGIAVAFNHMLAHFSRFKPDMPIALRMSLGGVAVGLCALVVPEVMSLGYDTINASILGQLGFATLVVIVFFKILATTAGLGFGLPGGLIGPTMFIGATAGAAMGALGAGLGADQIPNPGLFAMIGMGAMMAATLQAPLAALMAIFELTQNPYIILPGMLAIVLANFTTGAVLKQKSVFTALLQARGLDHRNDPVAQMLRSVGITSVVARDFTPLPAQCSRAEAQMAAKKNTRWILVDSGTEKRSALPAVDLVRFLEQNPDAETINLADIPANRLDAFPFSAQSSLQDTYEYFANSDAEAVYIERHWFAGVSHVYGVLTREDLETYKQKGRWPQ